MTSREYYSIGFIVFIVAALAIGFLIENKDEDLYTNICEGQGYTSVKITQYGRSTIWLCVDEDGILRIPKENNGGIQ